MRKIINRPEDVVEEMLEGYISAYNKYYFKHPNVNSVISKYRRKNKVSLVIGGGSGHEPMFSGFVGKGLADAAACGNIFASPDPNTIYQTGKYLDNGSGVIFVYGCYAGDNLNFDMGEEFLNAEGIKTSHVRVWDDIASAPKERIEDRRGIAGDVFVIKIAGAACDAGLSLEEVTKITEKARNNTKTIGVATSPAQLPGVDKPIFELNENEIEYGMGLHGERGVMRTEWQESDVLVEKMYKQLMEDANLKAGDEICILVNGLGSTTICELAIVYRKLRKLLCDEGIHIYDADLNQYCTSQEMGGFSITLFQLDEELKKYYDMPCFSPYYAKGDLVETSNEIVENVILEKEKIDDTEIKSLDIKRSHEGVLEALSAEDARNMLLYVATKIISNKSYLTEVDSQIGDGDHGIGMATGMHKVINALSKMEEEKNVYNIFKTAGNEMLLSMGGASGVIFGSLFLAGTKGMEAKSELSPLDLAQMERKSLIAIQERGKAKLGDKTMVDALAPAVVALEENAGKGMLNMLKEAELAAKKGVENTKEYVAKYGRAKSLMERSIGYQDAGATSVWLIFQAMREYVEGVSE